MKTFLEYVAADLLRKCGTDLSRTVVVFPNKRASLFLNEHLYRIANRPIWSPVYITISDLFRRHSSLEIGDPIKLVCDLHKTFTEVTGFSETLDHFYGWGQVMLSDFDDLDKHMADASKVFSNVRDLHELDDVSYLTPEQVEALRRFFSNFSLDSVTDLKRRFLSLWEKMYAIYTEYNKRLDSQGLAYEGALYRSVVADDALAFEYDRYVFVGFNMIQEVEHRLFKRLKDEGKAMFYWDFDHFYAPVHHASSSGGGLLSSALHEAGYFIRQNLACFPNELDITGTDIYDNYRRPKTITFATAMTEDIQARYVGQWLLDDVSAGKSASSDKRPVIGSDTAVVMCDESLLLPITKSIPGDISHVNITTGYPLHVSPLCSRLLSGLRKAKTSLAFVEWGKEFLVKASSDDTSVLHAECLYRLYTILQRLEGLIRDGELDVNIDTLGRLLQQLVRTTNVPFHGEPAIGLQVMGVLETRCLDFNNLLILSCSEGNLPKGISDTSFIPYNVRKAYGLTTIDHKVAIYAYYFYRLLQRAGNITIAYNGSTTDGFRGEMSRFMLQIMADRTHAIRFRSLVGGRQATPPTGDMIVKDDSIMSELIKRFFPSKTHHDEEPNARQEPLLTPTAINMYQRCQHQFYYKYVLGLRELEDPDGGVDNRIFGIIFHASAERLYKDFLINRGTVDRASIERLLKNDSEIQRVVDDVFRHEIKSTAPYSGLQLINREVIVSYLRRLLEKDLLLAPFTVVGLEAKVVENITINIPSPSTHHPSSITRPFTTTIGGTIDRLDIISDDLGTRLRVVDYKTGSKEPGVFNSIEAIFSPDKVKDHADYYLQTFLYALLVSRSTVVNPSSLPVSPALLFVQHTAAKDYDPTLSLGKANPIRDISTVADEFSEALSLLVDEIFSPEVPFVKTTNDHHCETCPYHRLCGVNK